VNRELLKSGPKWSDLVCRKGWLPGLWLCRLGASLADAGACHHRDLSMILCDPFAINTLSLSTVRHLQELVGQEVLPRVSAPGQPHAALGERVGVTLG